MWNDSNSKLHTTEIMKELRSISVIKLNEFEIKKLLNILFPDLKTTSRIIYIKKVLRFSWNFIKLAFLFNFYLSFLFFISKNNFNYVSVFMISTSFILLLTFFAQIANILGVIRINPSSIWKTILYSKAFKNISIWFEVEAKMVLIFLLLFKSSKKLRGFRVLGF